MDARTHARRNRPLNQQTNLKVQGRINIGVFRAIGSLQNIFRTSPVLTSKQHQLVTAYKEQAAKYPMQCERHGTF